MALGLKDIEKKRAKKVPKEKSSSKSAIEATAPPKRKRVNRQKASPWNSVGVPSDSVATVAATPQQPDLLSSPEQVTTETLHTNETLNHQTKRNLGMKEQGIQLLKKTIGLALEKKDEVIKSGTFQTFYGIGKSQIETQLAKYPKVQSELNGRIEKLGLCEKAQLVENLLREFAKEEVR